MNKNYEQLSDRRTSKNKETSFTKVDMNTARYSKTGKNKMYSSSSKICGNQKSTIISTIISNQNQREQKLKEDRKKH